MGTISDVASEFRANLTDALSYLIPGGLLLTAFAAGTAIAVRDSPTATAAVDTVGATFAAVRNALGEFWAGAAAVVLLAALSYACGAVLRSLDSWWGTISIPRKPTPQDHAQTRGQARWSALLAEALDESPTVAEALRALAQQELHWPATGGQQELHNLAQALLAHEGGPSHVFEQRQEAVADFHGHLAWVVLLSAIFLPAAAQPWNLRFPLLGVACLLTCQPLFVRLGWGPSVARLPVLASSVSLAICILPSFLPVVPLAQRVAGIAAPTMGMLVFLLLTRRQWSIHVWRDKCIWNAALVLLHVAHGTGRLASPLPLSTVDSPSGPPTRV